MEKQLSEIDHAMLVGQMNLIAWLKNQAAQLEKEVVIAVMMTYEIDLRKEGASLDLQNGVVRYVQPDTTAA